MYHSTQALLLAGSQSTLLPRPHTSEFSSTYHARWPDEDSYPVIPSGFLMPTPITTLHQNWCDLSVNQNSALQYYMEHVLRIQYLHADGSIDNLIWCLIHSSDT